MMVTMIDKLNLWMRLIMVDIEEDHGDDDVDGRKR